MSAFADFLVKYASLLAKRFAWPLFLGGLAVIVAGKYEILSKGWLNENADWIVFATILAGAFVAFDIIVWGWGKLAPALAEVAADARIRWQYAPSALKRRR